MDERTCRYQIRNSGALRVENRSGLTLAGRGWPGRPLLLMSGLAAFPSLAFAHVKWFVSPDILSQQGSLHFSLSDPAVQTWIAILVFAVLSAFLLHHFIGEPPGKLLTYRARWRTPIQRLVQLLIGIPLLISAVKGNLIAPHLVAQGSLVTGLLLIEGVAGVLLIANLWIPLASGLLILLMIGLIPLFGAVSVFEYSNILGMAIFLGLVSIPANHWLAPCRQWSLPLLRIIIGLTLIVLAFTEKLLNPELAMQVLAQYDLNFMKTLGIPYSDYLFVLSAGICEVLFGMIFVLGLITRVNVLALAVFLIASNTYFFATGIPAEGVKELIGHSPLFAAALVLLVYGGGDKLNASVWVESWIAAWVKPLLPQRSAVQHRTLS